VHPYGREQTARPLEPVLASPKGDEIPPGTCGSGRKKTLFSFDQCKTKVLFTAIILAPFLSTRNGFARNVKAEPI
jgi:hypothetical protein